MGEGKPRSKAHRLSPAVVVGAALPILGWQAAAQSILAQYTFEGATTKATAQALGAAASAFQDHGLIGHFASGPDSGGSLMRGVYSTYMPDAFSPSVFFSYKVTAAPQNLLDLSGLAFSYTQLGTGNYSPRFRLSVIVDGNTAYNLSSVPVPAKSTTTSGNLTTRTIDLSGVQYDDLSSVEFRWYLYDGQSRQGKDYAILFDNVTLNGAVLTPVLVPEPAAVGLLTGIGLIGGLAWRRLQRRPQEPA